MSGLEISSFVHLGWKKESGQRPAFCFYAVAVLIFSNRNSNIFSKASNTKNLSIKFQVIYSKLTYFWSCLFNLSKK